MRSPGGGLPPYELDRVIGIALERNLKQDEAFSVRDIHKD